jgi:hypothetical protein
VRRAIRGSQTPTGRDNRIGIGNAARDISWRRTCWARGSSRCRTRKRGFPRRRPAAAHACRRAQPGRPPGDQREAGHVLPGRTRRRGFSAPTGCQGFGPAACRPTPPRPCSTPRHGYSTPDAARPDPHSSPRFSLTWQRKNCPARPIRCPRPSFRSSRSRGIRSQRRCTCRSGWHRQVDRDGGLRMGAHLRTHVGHRPCTVCDRGGGARRRARQAARTPPNGSAKPHGTRSGSPHSTGCVRCCIAPRSRRWPTRSAARSTRSATKCGAGPCSRRGIPGWHVHPRHAGHPNTNVGAKLLLVGDWAQLTAVTAGGASHMLVRDRKHAPELSDVRRFSHDCVRLGAPDQHFPTLTFASISDGRAQIDRPVHSAG